MRPTNAPSRSVAPMLKGRPTTVSRLATVQAVRACSDPIERSSAPMATARVMPRAGTARMAAVMRTLEMLPG